MYGHTVIILIDLLRMEYCVYVCQLNVVTCILIYFWYHIFIPVLFLPIVSEFDNIYKTIENNNKTGLKNIY